MLPQIQAFDDLMLDAALLGAYKEVLSAIVPAEWVYLSWAKAAKHPYPKRFYLAEWMQLRDSLIFEEIVTWLRS
jgi:thiaminase/transcriptional activator TenA